MNKDQATGSKTSEEPSQSPTAGDPSDEGEDLTDRSDADNGAGGEVDDKQSEELSPLEQKMQELTDRIEALEEERDELNERVLRKAAEFENYRRRMDREKKRRHEAGMLEVIEPILEVLDDFERSIDAAEELQQNQDSESAYESLKGGVEMVFRKFRDTLESLGVEPIEAEGKPFDEELHDAMMRQPSEEEDPGTILQEIRKGYRMEDRVIRHSRVVVATEASDEEDGEGGE